MNIKINEHINRKINKMSIFPLSRCMCCCNSKSIFILNTHINGIKYYYVTCERCKNSSIYFVNEWTKQMTDLSNKKIRCY